MFPYPTHPLSGSNKTRQEVGDPGHCERCAEVGHVRAHRNLGCGDVGCNAAHGPNDPRDRNGATTTAFALTVLLPGDGTVWRCHTTTESHPDRKPCGWCARLPDSLYGPLTAAYPARDVEETP